VCAVARPRKSYLLSVGRNTALLHHRCSCQGVTDLIGGGGKEEEKHNATAEKGGKGATRAFVIVYPYVCGPLWKKGGKRREGGRRGELSDVDGWGGHP